MKNWPLLLFLVCLALGGLVWLDNRSAKGPERKASAPDPALQVSREATDESEPAVSTKSVQPAGDDNGQAAGDTAEPTTGEGNQPAAGPEAAEREGAGPEAPSGTAAVAEPQSGNPLASLDKSSLKDWVERPLFAPSRKRPPPAAAAQGPATVVGAKPLPPIYELLGVVSDRDRAIALLRKKSDGTSFRVQVGDMLGGWQVSKVEPRAVTLVRDDGTSETVPLFHQ